MCEGVFNFHFLAYLLSELLRGSQIYTMGLYVPWTPPSGEIFCIRSEYFTMSNCVFNFNILALVLFWILGVPNLHTLGGPALPGGPLAEKF